MKVERYKRLESASLMRDSVTYYRNLRARFVGQKALEAGPPSTTSSTIGATILEQESTARLVVG